MIKIFVLLIILGTFIFFSIYAKYYKITFNIHLIYFLIISIIYLCHYFGKGSYTYLFFIFGFLYLSVITDINEQWISDVTILSILLINVIILIVEKFIYCKTIIVEGSIFISIIIILIIIIQIVLKKELIGFGDLKLFLVLSINNSIMFVLWLLIISSLFGIIYYLSLKKKKDYFPFGPSIIMAYILLYIIKNELEIF